MARGRMRAKDNYIIPDNDRESMKKTDILKHHGKFKISQIIIERNVETVLELQSQIIIVRAESFYMTNEIEYMGYSLLFREVSLGEVVPEYEIYYENGKVVAKEVKQV